MGRFPPKSRPLEKAWPSVEVQMHASRLTAVAAVPLLVLFGFAAPAGATPPPKGPSIDHIVVIYEENHSFDNLFGGWERVDGLAEATAASPGRHRRHACCRACRRTTSTSPRRRCR